ncbi:UNVERIFIED_CONTAM: hypothetical protein FKN15_026585 [Acipenser sinensis]
MHDPPINLANVPSQHFHPHLHCLQPLGGSTFSVVKPKYELLAAGSCEDRDVSPQ